MIRGFAKSIVVNVLNKKIRKKGNVKRALVSYIVNPYFGINKFHSNAIEVKLIVKSLMNSGYNVDIVDYRNRVKGIKGYDLVFGFGFPVEKALSNYPPIDHVYYATGMPSVFQNSQSLKRLADYRSRYGTADGADSIRIAHDDVFALSRVQKIVNIGDSFSRAQYEKLTSAVVQTIPAVISHEKVCAYSRSEDIKKILWLGGKGGVHKGLDLLVEALINTEYELHVAGPIENESIIEFIDSKRESINIIFHGMVDLNEVDFSFCNFVILPSCSEGMATSVLNAIQLFGLYPLVSKYSGLNDLPYKNVIELDSIDIKKSLDYLLELPLEYFSEAFEANEKWMKNNCNETRFYNEIKAFLDENFT